MLPLFIATFNYTPEEFYSLTYRQAYCALMIRQKQDAHNSLMFRAQMRANNWYTVVATNGSKDYRKPEDLYTIEEVDGASVHTFYNEEQIEFFEKEIPEDDMAVIRRLRPKK